MTLSEIGEIDYFSHNIIFWEIPNFSLLSRKNGRIFSPLFCFKPKKSNKAFKSFGFQFEPLAGHVGLILSSALSMDISNEELKLGIVNSMYEEIASSSGEWIDDDISGHFRVRSIVDRKKLTYRGKHDQGMYFRVFIEVNSNHGFLPERRNDLECLNPDLKGLPRSHECPKTDLIIRLKDQEFTAHKKFLQITSKYFAEVLSDDTNIISITECDPEVFEIFLNFIYKDKIGCISPSVACELYYLAHKYVVEDLKQKCISLLKKFLCTKDLLVEDFHKIFYLFLKYSESELQDHVAMFFNSNMEAIRNTDEWLIFNKDYPLETCLMLLKAM